MALRLDRAAVRQLLRQGRIRATPDLLIELGEGPDRPRQPHGRRPHPGRNDALGFSPKSIWENNYGAYLQWLKTAGLILNWEYEPVVFKFASITRGTTEYRPDFRVDESADRHFYVEVKGFFDARSKTQLKRMRKYYPQEEVRVVGREWFAAAMRSGLAGAIPGWTFPEQERQRLAAESHGRP
jgi:hypothetical protein